MTSMLSMSSGLMSLRRETTCPPVPTPVLKSPSAVARLPTSLLARIPSTISSGSLLSDTELTPRMRILDPVPDVPVDCWT